jgi:hypothetical protein
MIRIPEHVRMTIAANGFEDWLQAFPRVVADLERQ